MDEEMMKALKADGRKLQQMTGQDHGPHFDTDDCLPDYGDPPDFEKYGACSECAGLGAWMIEGRDGWVDCEACNGTGEATE